MDKEDAPGGLFSKVVRFVRNPATNWSDLDNRETGREEELSKQLLKEMIERKRRNDFVRKREFDMLRKMRKREAMVGQDQGGRPSFFQSSMPSRPDDRASTLKKIDEIEAQMSMQWWKTKHSGASAHVGLNPSGPGTPASSQTTSTSGAARPVSAAASVPGSPASTVKPAPLTKSAAAAVAREGVSSGFTPSKFTAVHVEEVTHDTELEEASIRFANGDDAGAEAGLMEALGPQGSRGQHAETWLTLFDLYRATGQQDKFEAAAIEFVGRFERSAPQWFSMLQMAELAVTPAGKGPGAGPGAHWVSPSVLGLQTVAALKAALVKASKPWRLDWSNLKTIELGAVESLYKAFSDWSVQPVQLQFIGEVQLLQVLQSATPAGQQEISQDWWQLRLEALRVMHRADEFELVALDFCVTYEVSPPAWSSARCDYRHIGKNSNMAGLSFNANAAHEAAPSNWSVEAGDTVMDGLSSHMSNMLSVELAGQIQGDVIAVLDQLEVKMLGADIMLISCANLIRVDFSAAGTLLNWVSARQAENRVVQFSDVNRLVAAFFNMIGITEHARVLTRID